MFISRGQKKNRLNIYQLVCDGELADEMFELIMTAEEVTSEQVKDVTKENA